jgi:heme-degrading monooxygenase HmoA
MNAPANMSAVYTTGTWTLEAGKEDVFVEAWRQFAAWASAAPGAGTLVLTRDARDEQRFVSFGLWSDDDAVRSWKSSTEFREQLARVLQHVAEFEPTELAVVAAAAAGEAAG